MNSFVLWETRQRSHKFNYNISQDCVNGLCFVVICSSLHRSFNYIFHGYLIYWDWGNCRYKLHHSTANCFHSKHKINKKMCACFMLCLFNCLNTLFYPVNTTLVVILPANNYVENSRMNTSVKWFTLLWHNDRFASHSSSVTSDTFKSEVSEMNFKDKLQCGCHWLQNYRPYQNLRMCSIQL